MKPYSYTSEGIVLARRNFGEADRILVLFSKTHGKVSLIAKGVRRPKSKKRGHVEVFNKISFQAIAGRGIDLITEAEVIEDFEDIRKNLKKISLAYYFSEVVGKITNDGEPHIDLYNLISNNLEELKMSTELKKLRLSFTLKLLVILGYWPAGQDLIDVDKKLEEVIERSLSSMRVGKILSS